MFHVSRLAWPMAITCSILVSLVAIAAHFRGWPIEHALNVAALLIIGAMVLFATLCWWPQDEPMLDATRVYQIEHVKAVDLRHLADTEAAATAGAPVRDWAREVRAERMDLSQIEPVPGGFRARSGAS